MPPARSAEMRPGPPKKVEDVRRSSLVGNLAGVIVVKLLCPYTRSATVLVPLKWRIRRNPPSCTYTPPVGSTATPPTPRNPVGPTVATGGVLYVGGLVPERPSYKPM